MTPPGYPFAAILGQPELKSALLLASVDWRLSVLLKGDKGSGKSTAARGLADILPEAAPFVNLPLGATEDRLLGGLDLDRALRGEATLRPGLIHAAHGGVLYIDEVNLLADALTDALLDVASSGVHYVERDGFSAAGEAKFVLLGSMNAEEGGLRPQLLDRFALALDVEAPAGAGDRARIVDARARFDLDPIAFRAWFEAQQEQLRETIRGARALLPGIRPSLEILHAISEAVAGAGVRSLRADLAAARAAAAHAALNGRAEIAGQDIEAVLPLVLHHRAKRHPGQPPPPPPSPPEANPPRKPSTEAAEERRAEAKDRVFPPEAKNAPEIRVGLADAAHRGRSATAQGMSGAETARAGASPSGDALDPAASFTASFRKTGTAALSGDHLVFRTRNPRSGVRFIFVVDASGSQAAQERMRAVKGAASALLESSVDHKDEVAVISFRGALAEIVLEPCRDRERASRILEFLPVGGRTPLAHALQLAGSLATPSSVLILLTDGRANVPLAYGDPRGDPHDDPWSDALAEGRKLECPSILVDSSLNRSHDATRRLADAMQAQLIHLDEMSDMALINLLQR